MTINCNEREEWLEGDWQSWVLGQISRNCRSSLWSVQILTRPGPSFLAPYSSTQTLSIWSRPIFTTLPCTSYRTWRHWSHSSQTPSWDERRLTAWQDDSSEDVVTRRRSSKEKYLCPVLVLLLGQSPYKSDNLVLLLLYLFQAESILGESFNVVWPIELLDAKKWS